MSALGLVHTWIPLKIPTRIFVLRTLHSYLKSMFQIWIQQPVRLVGEQVDEFDVDIPDTPYSVHGRQILCNASAWRHALMHAPARQ